MSSFPRSLQLLKWVQRRLYLDQVVRRACTIGLVLAALYAFALLTGRLTGLWTQGFEIWTVALVPVIAFALALLWPWRPTVTEAAHAVDQQQATKDLYLTLTMLDDSAGAYKPLVGKAAEERAPRIKPEDVVPLRWERPSLASGGALALLVLGILFVPSFDPFNRMAQAKVQEEQRKLLDENQKINELRKAQLTQKDVEAENSEEVQEAIESLKVGLTGMKPGDRKQNQERLKEHQEEIAQLFREKMAESKAQQRSTQDLSADQKLGSAGDQDLERKMEKELSEGSTDAMQQQMQEVAEKMERLAESTDPVEKSKLEREVQKQLKEIAEFADKKTGSKALQEALERAQDALESMKDEGLSKEAMEALKESLQVAEQEAKLLGQAARDMKTLDEALEMISQAQQLNAQDRLDGEMMKGNMTLQDYQEMYAEMMGNTEGQGEGEGDGNGLGGRGIGEGGEAPEDDSAQTGFVPAESKSQIQQGKILLSMKTKGLSEAGEAKDEEYRKAVGEIKQNLEDVIDQEQIPPGYVDGIKKYFDTLESQGE